MTRDELIEALQSIPGDAKIMIPNSLYYRLMRGRDLQIGVESTGLVEARSVKFQVENEVVIE